MTTAWGGKSIPDPSTIDVAEDHVGTQYLTANGAMNTDTIKTDLQFSLTWELITYAQFGTIYTKALTNAASTLIMPIYGSVSVIPVRGQLQSSTVGGKSPLVNVSCTVRTVS